jgi:hypothetical protein
MKVVILKFFAALPVIQEVNMREEAQTRAIAP